ncbi:MAG: nucleotide-diphospho-sugar transferase [Arcticibacter sp.]
MQYQTSSAILFLIFNRPDTTSLVFERIREARPTRLYVAADGPRTNREGEHALCNETRSIINTIDWDCEVKTRFQDKNLGCKYAVSTAISWFFDQEDEGIILEDDCLPASDFFRFCDLLLQRYRHDTRVTQIVGCNFQAGKKWGAASYYFSNNLEVWGWASWKRVWQLYDAELNGYSETDVEETIQTVFSEPIVTAEYLHLFKELKAGKIDTWDYQLKLINFFNNGLSIVPNANLISNIGFRPDATHTHTPDLFADIPHGQLDEEINHPRCILPSRKADTKVLNLEFQIDKRKNLQNKLKNRIKHWLKG